MSGANDNRAIAEKIVARRKLASGISEEENDKATVEEIAYALDAKDAEIARLKEAIQVAVAGDQRDLTARLLSQEVALAEARAEIERQRHDISRYWEQITALEQQVRALREEKEKAEGLAETRFWIIENRITEELKVRKELSALKARAAGLEEALKAVNAHPELLSIPEVVSALNAPVEGEGGGKP